jgi:hypothetical protein
VPAESAGDEQPTLDSQTLAAFGAAGVDHSPATLGAHACAKTMGALAADYGGLICAFHDGTSKEMMTS